MSTRIKRGASALLIIDIQAKLAPHIAGHEELIRRSQALLDAARLFEIPKLVTEHCPQNIGAVIAPLRAQFAPDEIFEKNAFGAADHPAFVERVRSTRRTQFVIAGMEAHVCVLQTALALREHGFGVVIAADAVGSRAVRALDRELALLRMREAGCIVAGTETVLYEWTGTAVDARFREVLAIVKSI